MSGDDERSHDVLSRLFKSHQATLWAEFSRATEFEHRGTRGQLRESAVSNFLKRVLPHRYGVVRGQAVDARGRQSRQLDIIVYDRIENALLVNSDEADCLVPAEAILAVVEVKSSLTAGAVNEAVDNAMSVRALSPYGKRFITRVGGEVYDNKPRSFYSVLSYQSDLTRETWLESEWRRLKSAAERKRTGVAIIDRVVVLDRGLLVPPYLKGRVGLESDASLLYWYLHLTDYLARESPRRKPVSFRSYSERRERGWTNLEPRLPEREDGAPKPLNPVQREPKPTTITSEGRRGRRRRPWRRPRR